MRPRLARIILIAPFAIVGMALFIFLGGYIVMRLWNWLAPALFAWHAITFWQALGILVLCRILFGGLGRHGYRRGPRFTSRMTPEERERWRQRMRERCGFSSTSSESTGQAQG